MYIFFKCMLILFVWIENNEQLISSQREKRYKSCENINIGHFNHVQLSIYLFGIKLYKFFLVFYDYHTKYYYCPFKSRLLSQLHSQNKMLTRNIHIIQLELKVISFSIHQFSPKYFPHYSFIPFLYFHLNLTELTFAYSKIVRQLDNLFFSMKLTAHTCCTFNHTELIYGHKIRTPHLIRLVKKGSQRMLSNINTENIDWLWVARHDVLCW